MSEGIDANGHGKEGVSPFYTALINGNFEVADVFIRYGANPNGTSAGGSFITLAIERNNLQALEYLDRNGAVFKPHSPSHKLAQKTNNPEIIKYFEQSR